LNQHVEHAVKLLSRTIPKMIEISTQLAPDMKPIFGDPGQIEQIILNLAINARDAMPEGGKLTISTAFIAVNDAFTGRPALDPGEYVLLRVADTGQGMEKQVLDHVFEPFYTTKRPGEGTGLGLAMVYGIVKAHNGVIKCYSEPGKGTSFEIYFPIMDHRRNPEVEDRQTVPSSGTETVLLVEDEEQIRTLAHRILSRAGFSVLTANNGMEALDLYKKNMDKISVVVLDWVMPGMGGKQCLEGLLKLNPKIMALIASGLTSDEQKTAVLKSGAKGFIGKPYKAGEFLHVIRAVLDQPQSD
jgi:two-component system, cell cycle sensor histidine kinase and response regulator CckA